MRDDARVGQYAERAGRDRNGRGTDAGAPLPAISAEGACQPISGAGPGGIESCSSCMHSSMQCIELYFILVYHLI